MALAVVTLAAGLSACSSSGNEDAAKKRNTENLEAGSKQPYPNLADVPPPPDRALSGAERDALEKSLIADRENAKYIDEELRASRGTPGVPPPPATSGKEGGAAPATSAPAEGAAPPAKSAASPGLPGVGPRRTDDPKAHEEPPQESSLASPQVRSLPQGETPRPPPPAPEIPPPSAERPAAPPPAPPAAASAPPPPEVAAATPPAAPAPSTGRAVSVQVASITFAIGSSKVPAGDHDQLAQAAKLHSQYGGIIRVIGYAQPGRGSDAAQQELQSFGLALDRAKAVALALTEIGVPAKEVAVDAAPVLSGGGLNEQRTEVYLEY